MEQVESLKKQLEDEIQKNKGKTDIRNRLVVAALEGDKNRLEQIESILKIEKYDLVFIGQQGVGKTTAICHLFGLTTEKVVKTKKGEKTIERTVTQELLSTGSGKTTLCEVVIIPDETTFIEIVPFAEKDLEQLVDEFCLLQWKIKEQQKDGRSPIHPEREDDQTSKAFPTELKRAVENMAELNPSQLDELLKETEEQEDFCAKILDRCRISQRTETRIDPAPSEQNERNWIRETFHSLNYCNLKNCSIPKSISIHINNNLLNSEHFSNIKSIIDTKGIGAGEVRKDIDNYLQSEKRALCLLVEGFASVPTNVIGLMKQHLTPEAQDISSKVLLLVIPRKNEPEQTSGAGADCTREGGIAYRKRDIEDTFISQKLNLPQAQENVIFYDPLEYYLREGSAGFRADPDFSAEEFNQSVIAERNRILSVIQSRIEKRRQILEKELQGLANHLKSIKEGKGIAEQDEQLLKEMKDKISEFKHFLGRERDAGDFIHEYVTKKIAAYHHMTLRAINSRYGRYDVKGIDIYYDVVPLAKSFLKEVTQSHKDKIVETVKLGMEDASPELHILIQNLESQVNSGYNDLIVKFTSDISDHLENVVFYPQDRNSEFWRKVQDRWGGTGYKTAYKADVVGMYRDRLIDKMKLEPYISTEIKGRWQKFVEENVLTSL